MQVQEMKLPSRYHDALLAWQQANFGDLSILLRHWEAHFPGEPIFHLTAKVAPLKDSTIEVGAFKGQPRITRAAEMKGNMLYSALRIVKAQCSTELGSIQQHLETLDSGVSDQSKFSILRICAEELRHAYQMFWVLSHDASWAQAGIHDIANQTLDELLAMRTGTHVLDAFNIPFGDPLDNMMFSFLIDRVGKYQLAMQKVFAYAPMAASMAPMLTEESFHLKTGNDLVRDMAVASASGSGRWSLEEIQRRLNAWFPRAIEMFGSPTGGQANVTFGFKDCLNGASIDAYTLEVERLVRRINIAIVVQRSPGLTRSAAERLADEDPNLLRLPHVNFFRMRGEPDVVHQPIDVNGRRIPRPAYWRHLEQVLPATLRSTQFFKNYRAAFSPAIN